MHIRISQLDEIFDERLHCLLTSMIHITDYTIHRNIHT